MRQSDGGTIKVLDPKSPLAGVEVVIAAGALPRATETVRLSVSRASVPTEFSSLAQKQPDLLFRLISLGEARGEDAVGATYHPIMFPLVSLLASPQRMGPVMDLQPSGVTFSQPVTVKVPFQVLEVDGLIDGAVFPALGTQGADGSVAWELISDFEIDQANRQLVFRTKHFSLFDVFRMALDKADDSLGKEWQNLGRWSRTHLEEARRDFPNKSTLSPLLSFAQAVTCTERDPTPSTDPPGLVSLLSHLGGKLGRGSIETGQEDALQKWLQGMNQLSAAAIYAKAHQLNNGDVFKALLTAHNALRGIIRPHADQKGLTPEAQQLMAKTAPLRGDGDDEAGALYHFFGTAVYGFAWSHYVNLLEAKSLLQSDLALYLGPDLIVHVEERVISTDFWSDPREAVVDLAGMDLGKQLYRQVHGKTMFELRQYRLDPSTCARLLGELPNLALFRKPGEAADVTLAGQKLPSGAFREGTPLTLNWAVYNASNQGTSAAVSIIVSLDGHEVLRTFVQDLEANGSQRFTANLGSPQVGSHTVRVTINPEQAPESDYSDNTRTITFTVESPPQPPATLTVNPSSVVTGSSVVVRGEGFTPDAQVILILGGVRKGFSGVNPDGTFTASILVDVPAGSHVLSATDGRGRTATATLTVHAASAPNITPSKFPGYSDILVVSNDTDPLNPTATLQAGTVYVYGGIVNSGTVNASGPFFVTLYLDGVQVHQYQYPSGESLRAGIPLALGPITLRSVTSGQHTLRLVVDSSNAVDETNENDNVYVTTIRVSGPAGRPNLTLVPCPTSCEGEAIHYEPASDARNGWIFFGVTNNGNVPITRKFVVRLLIDGVFVEDTEMPPGPSLDIGETAEGFFIINVPAGPHTARVALDYTGVIEESNERDNALEISFDHVVCREGCKGEDGGDERQTGCPAGYGELIVLGFPGFFVLGDARGINIYFNGQLYHTTPFDKCIEAGAYIIRFVRTTGGEGHNWIGPYRFTLRDDGVQRFTYP